MNYVKMKLKMSAAPPLMYYIKRKKGEMNMWSIHMNEGRWEAPHSAGNIKHEISFKAAAAMVRALSGKVTSSLLWLWLNPQYTIFFIHHSSSLSTSRCLQQHFTSGGHKSNSWLWLPAALMLTTLKKYMSINNERVLGVTGATHQCSWVL